MLGYDFTLSGDASRFLLACPPRLRRMALDEINTMVQGPFRSADFHETGLSGRRYEVKLAGPIAITYWVDHAAKEVRIIKCELADG